MQQTAHMRRDHAKSTRNASERILGLCLVPQCNYNLTNLFEKRDDGSPENPSPEDIRGYFFCSVKGRKKSRKKSE